MKLHQLLGSPRTLQAWLKSELIDASKGNQLKAVVWQYRSEQVVPAPASKNEQVTEQVTPQVTRQVMTKLGSSRGQVGIQPESLGRRFHHSSNSHLQSVQLRFLE